MIYTYEYIIYTCVSYMHTHTHMFISEYDSPCVLRIIILAIK